MAAIVDKPEIRREIVSIPYLTHSHIAPDVRSYLHGLKHGRTLLLSQQLEIETPNRSSLKIRQGI
jgi:hypothetical protein